MRRCLFLAVVLLCGCGNPAVEKAYDELLRDRDEQIKAGVEKAVGDMPERLKVAEALVKELRHGKTHD